ncbi:MAG: GW dipeptide domain-containing protein [Lachnospiraceae bacterium]|nr:GW dipeptide domain-containing protein [Lachnospiraceae bacterium]
MAKKYFERIMVLLLVVALALPGTVSRKAEAAVKGVTGKVIATELYMRNGPGTSYSNICNSNNEKVVLVKDQEVTLYKLVDDWYFLSAVIDGKKTLGYSLGSYISTDTEFTSISLAEFTGDANVSMPDTAPYLEEKTNGADPDENGIGRPVNTVDKTDEKPATVSEKFEISTKFSQTGEVTAELLNMRQSSSIVSNVLGVLKNGDKIWLVGTTVNTIKVDGVNKKVRWYRVVAMVDGVPVRGYVLSDYVRLDYDKKLTVKNKYSKQVLYSKASSGSSKVKTASGKSTVKLPKGTVLNVVAEKQTSSYKWLKVTCTYKDNNVYTGYIKSLRTDYVTNLSTLTINYEVPVEPDAEIVQNPEDFTVDNGNNEGNGDAGNGQETNEGDKPDTDKKPSNELENANAVVINAAALSVKLEPKYSSSTLFSSNGTPIFIYTGQKIQVVESTTDADGNVWYFIRLMFNGSEYYGYVNKNYVKTDANLKLVNLVTDSVPPVLTFDEWLNQEGFPESYREPLRLLHEKYPSWIFKGYKTGLDWGKVIDAESEVGVNLLPNTKSVEWKSLAERAYSWKNDTFTVFDGSSWVTASREAVEYYMDPRNFLDEASVFQFEVLTYNPSFQTREGVEKILKNTAMNGASYEYTDELGEKRSISYADTFMMAAEYSGVSPLHLASRVKQEVTIGANAMSNSVTGTVSGLEGLYNYYNIGAYHSTAAGGAIANGLNFAKTGSSSSLLNMNCLIPWNNRLRSILGGAFYIGNNYINRGQDTIYLQKFNVTPGGNFWHQYMANVEAPYSEGRRVFNAYEDPAELAIVFSIPIYENMPENACPLPEKKYNPNNWLKSLALYDKNGDKLALTPTFTVSADTNEYSIIVDSDTDYIKVSASTVSALATIVSDNYIYPEVGKNRFAVKVKAENGDVRKYIINIVREEPETAEPENTEPEEGSAEGDTSADNSDVASENEEAATAEEAAGSAE